MIVTDKTQIGAAIADILAQEAYVSLAIDDFNLVCPKPSAMIHVYGESAEEAARKLKDEWANAGLANPKAMLVSIKGDTLLMKDLETIDKALPDCPFIKKGLDFAMPKDGNVEIVLFVP